MGAGVFAYLEAIMTFDQVSISELFCYRIIHHFITQVFFHIFIYEINETFYFQAHIASAIEVLNTSSETINSYRIKGRGIVDSITKLYSIAKFAPGARQDANAYSELEMHAELCYAEVMLLRAVLTLCEDENLVSFVKAGLKVRSCFQSFR